MPKDPIVLHALIACLTDINVWMGTNLLKLNEEKAEVILIEPNAAR